ncbi:MAG: hypothetical protein WC346_09355 [Methanogenium sp.]|jgi:hypothetical protein
MILKFSDLKNGPPKCSCGRSRKSKGRTATGRRYENICSHKKITKTQKHVNFLKYMMSRFFHPWWEIREKVEVPLKDAKDIKLNIK